MTQALEAQTLQQAKTRAPTIAVLNHCSVLSDQEVQAIVAALQKQVDNDWFPLWGSTANLQFVARRQAPPAGSWWLAFLDNSDQAGALGYHDVTSEGLPLGKVFAGSDKQFGYSPSVTASHELLEMLGDPDINLTALVDTGQGTGRLYAYEVCDPVEADNLGYDIDRVMVSDFVLPGYFESFRTIGPFDFKNHLDKPFQLAPGGYISYMDISSSQGWQQEQAETMRDSREGQQTARYMSRPRLGSRRERRRTSRRNWVRSTAFTADRPKLDLIPGQ
jgi:hypothetical protein